MATTPPKTVAGNAARAPEPEGTAAAPEMLETVSDLDDDEDHEHDGDNGVRPTNMMVPSGTFVEVSKIDVDHPAVDNHPRANTTAEMNKIDFNDPRPSADVRAEAESANQAD